MADTPSPLRNLELTCFGAPSARVDGSEPPLDVMWRKHLALLIYLALSPDRTRTREHLRGLLWPEKDEQKARRSLNEALRRLRADLGDDRLVSRGDLVEMSGELLGVDALRLLDPAVARDPARALALVRGDFLEGFGVDDAPAFEEWAMHERERQRTRVAAMLVEHGEKLLATGRFTDARDSARRALAIQPFAEHAARLVMRSAALGGDQAGALAAFHEFGKRLEEIGEKPSRELAALRERIRQQPSRPAPVHPEDIEPPLVGRERTHVEAFAIQDALSRGPRVLVVTGAPGMGRSRLLTEVTRRLSLDGAVVAQARPLESDVDSPWSTLRLLMRGGLADAPGLMGTAPADLGVLAGVVPDLAARSAPRPALDSSQVGTALQAALAAAAEEKPLLLVIDDAHLADSHTLGALRVALQGPRRAQLALVLSAIEPADRAPREWRDLRAEVGRGLQGTTVRLDPLTDADLRLLVDALAPWCKEGEDRARLVRRLAHETSGSPFFAVTLLRGLARMVTFREDFVAWPPKGQTLPSPLFSLPDLTRTAITARVADLPKDGQRVLSAASLCGLALDFDLLVTLTDLPRAQVEEQVTEAERRHLIRFDGERYAFTAPLMAEVVRADCLTPGQRTTLTQRAVDALASRTDFEARILTVELKARTRPGPVTFDEAITLGRFALENAGARATQRAIGAALRAAGKEPTAEQRLTIERLQTAVGQLNN